MIWLHAAGSILLALPAASSPEAPPKLGTDATIQSLMLNQVDPAADRLWALVGTTITAGGAQDKEPRTPADWRAARRLAESLVEAADSLLGAPRRVAAPGSTLDDANVPGIESPASMQRAIDADPVAFRTAASALRGAGLKAIAAIDQRNADALIEAGGELDEACEGCHFSYWYPHSPHPR